MENKDLSENKLENVVGGDVLPVPSPSPAPSPSPEAGSIANRAYTELGKPYAWGGIGPEAYDASGLVSYCVSGVHARIGTTDTFLGWERVSNPSVGDICVNSVHCGIYIGGGQMIHAPTFGQAVQIGSVQSGMIFVKKP